MYYTKDDVVKAFTSFGYSFRHFELFTEGDYHTADAEFNYADIPHVPYIHKVFQTIPAIVESDKIGTLHFQKILGMPFPLAVATYHHNRTLQSSYFTFLMFMVVVDTEFIKVGDLRTRVVSRYSIGCSKFFKIFTPIVQKLLTANYYDLMKDDVPMRERRGLLRKWGYTFGTDSRRYGYEESMDLNTHNLIAPAKIDIPFSPIEIDLEKSLPQGSTYLFGRTDHLGLKAERSKDEILFYPRICPHEGASLDNGKCLGAKIQCAWHGKIIAPLAKISLVGPKKTRATTPHHEINLDNGKLSINLTHSKPLQQETAISNQI